MQIEIIQGDISKDHHVDAVVNAANPGLYHGGGGTNGALSRIIPSKEWDEQRDLWREKAGKEELEVSEAVLFELKQFHAKYLIHALGPDLRMDPEKPLHFYKQDVYQAYKNVFKLCRENKIESVLVPLISGAIFAGPFAKNPLWKSYIKEALLQAIHEEPPTSSLKLVKIIDLNPIH